MSSKTFSQTTVLSKTGDTMICFTVDQSKFLLKKYYECEQWKQLDSVCEQQLVLKDSVIASNDRVIKMQSEIIGNDKKIIELREYEVESLTTTLKEAEKKYRRQKIYKFIAGGLGAAGTIAMGVLYVLK